MGIVIRVVGRNEMHDQPQVGLHIHATSSALHSSTAWEEADAADQKTVRQNRALALPAPSSNPKPKLNLSRPVGEVEDYSDMEQAFGEDEGSLEKKLRILKVSPFYLLLNNFIILLPRPQNVEELTKGDVVKGHRTKRSYAP